MKVPVLILEVVTAACWKEKEIVNLYHMCLSNQLKHKKRNLNPAVGLAVYYQLANDSEDSS